LKIELFEFFKPHEIFTMTSDSLKVWGLF